ncbi:MAG: NACHT domain-containing protein [Cyanobacteria bacterium P01_D01_bin.156]
MPTTLIPTDFLKMLANDYKLTAFETEAFIARMTNMGKSDVMVAENFLKITRERYSTRMTGVYRKFNVKGEGAGKSTTLFFKVVEIYQKSDPSGSYEVTIEAVDKIVSKIQEKMRPLILERCDSMRIFDMSSPVKVENIFTKVRVRKEISSYRSISIPRLVEISSDDSKYENYQYLSRYQASGPKISGIDIVKANSKLIILGKPGAGKTTFLKHLALLACNQSKELSGYIPAFVPLKDFCAQNEQKSLKDFILSDFQFYGVPDSELEATIKNGRFIFLLDGLDEIQESNAQYIRGEIRNLSRLFHRNKFIVTCRLAAQEYSFENFIEVEVCDFNDEQIKGFIISWFKERERPERAHECIQRIENDLRIKELSTNPLLLTLLCIVFGDSPGDFPDSRSELYEQGIDVLLRKWDATRDINRAKIYKNLSKQKKEDLLSQIAYSSFQRNEYLLKQKTVEHEIRNYILNLPSSTQSPQTADTDCRKILKAVEYQHGLLIEVAKGIYSFSHLTFHEYFTGKKIVRATGQESQAIGIDSLVEHIFESRYREIFLLVSCMLQDASYLMQSMKQKNDLIVQDNEKFKNFFLWLDRKSSSVIDSKEIENIEDPEKLKSHGQILYFRLAIETRDLKKLKRVKHQKNLDFETDSLLSICLQQTRFILESTSFSSGLLSEKELSNLRKTISAEHSFVIKTLQTCNNLVFDGLFKAKLSELCSELKSAEKTINWWLSNGNTWIRELSSVMLNFRDIGQQWGFEQDELKILRKYYDASQLMEDCLNQECYVNSEIRITLTNNILLPLWINDLKTRNKDFSPEN